MPIALLERLGLADQLPYVVKINKLIALFNPITSGVVVGSSDFVQGLYTAVTCNSIKIQNLNPRSHLLSTSGKWIFLGFANSCRFINLGFYITAVDSSLVARSIDSSSVIGLDDIFFKCANTCQLPHWKVWGYIRCREAKEYDMELSALDTLGKSTAFVILGVTFYKILCRLKIM